MKKEKKKIGVTLLITLGLIAIIIMFSKQSISQNDYYHNFSDTRAFLSISNF